MSSAVFSQFNMNEFSELQKQFYSAFDYNGVISGVENHWFRGRIQGNNFENNHYGVVFAKARSESWLPALGSREKPSALIRCEVVKGSFCEGEIISLTPGITERDLEGAKVKWL